MGCGSSINYQVFKGSKRGQMRLQASYDEDFLTHHLSNQASLSQYASTDAIKKRQIIAHMLVDQINGRCQSDRKMTFFYSQAIIKSWMQRLFVDSLQQMDEDYFKLGKSYDVSREKLSDRYLFEIYQMKQFFHAGAHRLKDKAVRQTYLLTGFSLFGLQSDAALFPILKTMKQKYPQVADNTSIKFPDVKELKQDTNLLGHFNSKCLSDTMFKNIGTTTLDLKFLFDTAFDQFQDFKTDMAELLGADVLADVKVKCVDSEERGRTYNASSTRRVLIKWVETLLEKIPENIYSRSFVEFLITKGVIMNNFHVKSTIETETTHNTIIRVLLKLIEEFKFDAHNGKPKQNFGFFIYDLLRCKTHREDGAGVVELIDRMKATKVTKSGKKLEVLRVKNRLKTPNRDVMVNFRYGDIIVAQAQLGIDSSTVSQKDKKTNKFNHYLYQLQRGLFGPTVQLMMQYQDFNRKDVIVDLKIQDTVVPRKSQKQEPVEKIDRKCPVGHQMVGLRENYFMFLKNFPKKVNQELTFDCDYCLTKELKMIDGYDYCYKCSLFYCHGCRDLYKKSNPVTRVFSINQKLQEFNSKDDLIKFVKAHGHCTLTFVDSISSISQLTTDYMAYLNSFFLNKLSTSIPVATVDIQKPWGKQFAKEISVNRFPTFVAFDRNCQPRKRLIGASILHIDWFTNYAEQLKNPAITTYPYECAQHSGSYFTLVNVEHIENWVCRLCHNAQSIDSFGSFMQSVTNDRETAFQCPHPHEQVYINELGDQQKDTNFICKNCAYLSCQDDSITFFDVTGKSYLSSKPQKQFNKSCKNKHKLQHIHKNHNDNYKLVCSDCTKIFIFSKEEGIGYCRECNYVLCPHCLGIEIIGLDKDRIKRELICNFAEMTASEVLPCKKCFNLYTKQYNSPKPIKFKADEGEDEDLVFFQEAFFSMLDLKWECTVCKKEFSCNELHLACNPCMQECCLNCATELFEGLPEIVHKPVSVSPYRCPKGGHQILETTEAPDPSTTKFQCASCKIILTINTLNYWCKDCNHRYCNLCAPSVLKPLNNTCPNNHPLASKPNYLSDYLPCALNPNHIIHQTETINQHQQTPTIYYCDLCKFYACHPTRCKQPMKQCPKKHNLRLKKELSYRRFCVYCERFIDPLSYCCELCDVDVCFKCYREQPNGKW